MTSDLLALCAIVLWGSLATLAVALAGVPPFLLTGSGLLIGSLLAWPLSRFDLRRWRVPPTTLALGAPAVDGAADGRQAPAAHRLDRAGHRDDRRRRAVGQPGARALLNAGRAAACADLSARL